MKSSKLVKKIRIGLLSIAMMVTLSSMMISCYSLKGITIPPTTDSFFVEDFTIKSAVFAPGDLDQVFAETLRSKVRNESRLVYDTKNPDIEFLGEITKYRTTSEAPIEGRLSALNRLEIAVKVTYVNNTEEDDTWVQTFSFFENYDGNVDLSTVEDELIESILSQLTEDIFNKAFTNW